ncbi:MAG: cytochrome c biogenesis protein CcdA [Clostridia bacterium]|nr:cytochrome c biogenesis protein CcdA [Clostridia bacterium]
MQIFITFLEGIISFVSPCMLPMLPVYISYFASDGKGKRKTVADAVAFVCGFTAVFCVMGVFAGTIGSFLTRYSVTVNIVCGVVVIILGLSYLDIIPLPFFRGLKKGAKITGIFSAFVFGMVYSVSLTPCVGAFLGSALMLASTSASAPYGALLLFVYSLGLGIPFVLSAWLMEKLGGLFGFVKKHYKTINIVSGVFLIVVGIFIATGSLDRFLSVFSGGS